MAGAGLKQAGASIGLLPLISAFFVASGSAEAAAQQLENSLEILAVRVREQGHACDRPLKAEQDLSASRPMSKVWLLQCSNASYRIALHPDMGAQIEVIKQ